MDHFSFPMKDFLAKVKHDEQSQLHHAMKNFLCLFGCHDEPNKQ